jgi:hypothetical protein
MSTRDIKVTDLVVGHRIPSNLGTFTVTKVETAGRKVVAHTREKTPEGKSITFNRGEIVAVIS